MAGNKTLRDPLPARFKTVEEFVDFWDKHDTEDYPEAWREVSFTVAMKERKYPRIILEPKLTRQLYERANAQGVSLNRLINQLLKDALNRPAK